MRLKQFLYAAPSFLLTLFFGWQLLVAPDLLGTVIFGALTLLGIRGIRRDLAEMKSLFPGTAGIKEKVARGRRSGDLTKEEE